jgi:glutathione S-transferase
MKLYGHPASPYVRKVLVLAHEVGLAPRIELVNVDFSELEPSAELIAHNPVCKIPTLVRDDGTALFDSNVICEYLDTLHGAAPMFPPKGEQRWSVLRRLSLASGIMDAAVTAKGERTLRKEGLRWDAWIEAQCGKFRRALDTLEGDAKALEGALDIGKIAVGCALGYLDFRFANEGWRGRHPALAAWFQGFSARPSMQATSPAG